MRPSDPSSIALHESIGADPDPDCVGTGVEYENLFDCGKFSMAWGDASVNLGNPSHIDVFDAARSFARWERTMSKSRTHCVCLPLSLRPFTPYCLLARLLGAQKPIGALTHLMVLFASRCWSGN